MATRQIVVNTINPGPSGLQIVNFTARVAISLPARQAYYASKQAGLTPSAPGAYATTDAQEVTDFRAGLFRECPLFDVIDPTLSVANIEARLVRLATTVGTNATNDDTSVLSFYGTSYDGTTWTTKSA